MLKDFCKNFRFPALTYDSLASQFILFKSNVMLESNQALARREILRLLVLFSQETVALLGSIL